LTADAEVLSWRNPDVLFCSCGQEFHSMDEAGIHWDQFTDHTIKDPSGNVHFVSVKDLDPADYEGLNHILGEWECRCGKKFDRLGDVQMHLNGTHTMVKSVQYPLSDAAEKHRAELKERRARGETSPPDPDHYYECTCGEVFFSLADGILHMDDNPFDKQSRTVHLISGKHYGHTYVCSCGEEFATDLTSMEHLSKNPNHKITRKGPQQER